MGNYLIQKVKPPGILKLVHSSKQTKTDLGGQSGESFSRHQTQKEPTPESAKALVPELSNATDVDAPPLETAPIDHQVGLTQVVKEWIEAGKAGGNSINAQKLSIKYQGESAPAKGMLLNKKIS
jgi:hypothetical protein